MVPLINFFEFLCIHISVKAQMNLILKLTEMFMVQQNIFFSKCTKVSFVCGNVDRVTFVYKKSDPVISRDYTK